MHISKAPADPRNLSRKPDATLSFLPPRLKLGSGLHRQHDSGVRLLEFLKHHRAAARAWVVEVHLTLAVSLDHQKVVEVPKDNVWVTQAAEPWNVFLKSLRLKPVCLGRGDDIGSSRSVSRHSAFTPQLRQWDVAPIIAEHDRQRGGSAFGGLHLQDGRCSDTARRQNRLAIFRCHWRLATRGPRNLRARGARGLRGPSWWCLATSGASGLARKTSDIR